MILKRKGLPFRFFVRQSKRIEESINAVANRAPIAHNMPSPPPPQAHPLPSSPPPHRPSFPPPHGLARLGVPGKGGLWKFRQVLSGPDARRAEFRRLIANQNHDKPDTLPKLRTLVDLGLWSDFIDTSTLPGTPPPGLATVIARDVLDVFGSLSLSDTLRLPEQVARNMFSSLDWYKARPVPVEILHLLIEAGLDPDTFIESPSDHHLLAHLACRGDGEQALLVLKAGAGPYRQKWPHNTAAHVLVNRATPEDMQLLSKMIKAGLDINEPGEQFDPYRSLSRNSADGFSIPPIGMAIIKNNMPLVQSLMDKGANLDWPGHTAFHTVANSQEDRPPREVYQIMDSLLALGAKFDEPSLAGQTPLWKSIPKLPVKAKWLVEHGARIDIKVSTGQFNPLNKTLFEHLIESVDNLGPWIYLIDAIEAAHPDCWTWVSSNPGPGIGTVLDMAHARGGEWASRASAHTLGEQVATTPIEMKTAALPRF